MNKNRIEAFSDSFIAIVNTIMVLELNIPELYDHYTDKEVWDGFISLSPHLLYYLLSFIVVTILWHNHHRLFDPLPHSTSRLVWYNAFFLFVISLIPLPTAYLAKHPMLKQAVMFYGFIMSLNYFAMYLMRRYIEVYAKLIPHTPYMQQRNMLSSLFYFVSIPAAFLSIHLSIFIFIAIPIWYFIPDIKHK